MGNQPPRGRRYQERQGSHVHRPNHFHALHRYWWVRSASSVESSSDHFRTLALTQAVSGSSFVVKELEVAIFPMPRKYRALLKLVRFIASIAPVGYCSLTDLSLSSALAVNILVQHGPSSKSSIRLLPHLSADTRFCTVIYPNRAASFFLPPEDRQAASLLKGLEVNQSRVVNRCGAVVKM